MHPETIELLCCPRCRHDHLKLDVFSMETADSIKDGVIVCTNCSHWYPIDDGLPDMLTGALAYTEDRARFWSRHEQQMRRLNLQPDATPEKDKTQELQIVQQQHFDWYATNSTQTYDEYEVTPFWLAADRLAFEPWRTLIKPGTRLLDVGCAQGRSLFKFLDLDIEAFGFDVSKHLVRQALNRYRQGTYRARAAFFAADAMYFPFRNGSFDTVVVYGVLHHVPDIPTVCHEIARVLKTGGVYLGSENHTTVFRGIFEFLQKVNPLWHEEAGPEALISHERLAAAFAGTPMHIKTQSAVFLPPHVYGWMSTKLAYDVLRVSDRIGQSVPLLKDNGGLILIHATHP